MNTPTRRAYTRKGYWGARVSAFRGRGICNGCNKCNGCNNLTTRCKLLQAVAGRVNSEERRRPLQQVQQVQRVQRPDNPLQAVATRCREFGIRNSEFVGNMYPRRRDEHCSSACRTSARVGGRPQGSPLRGDVRLHRRGRRPRRPVYSSRASNPFRQPPCGGRRLTPPPCGARKTLRTFVCLRFSTAAEIPASLHLPLAARSRNSPGGGGKAAS